jgi:hypothetical protein
MDCASSDLALVLKLIDKTDCEQSCWSELARVIVLGERYQFKHMPDLIRHPASLCIDNISAIPIFQFAASNRFHDLAKLAIAGFAGVFPFYTVDYDGIPLSSCEGIPGKYGAALVIAVAKNPRSTGLTPKVRWERISAAFDVLG